MTDVATVSRSSFLSNMITSKNTSNEQINSETKHVSSTKCEKPAKNIYRQPCTQRSRSVSYNSDHRKKLHSGKFLWFSINEQEKDSQKDDSAAVNLRRHSYAGIDESLSFPILKQVEQFYIDELSNDNDDKLTSSASMKTFKEHIENKQRDKSYKKQTSFCDNVDVIYYDRSEITTSLTGRETEKLHAELPDCDCPTETVIHLFCPLPGHGNKESLNSLDCDCSMDTNAIFKNKVINVITGENRHFWEIFIPMGHDFVRNRCSVKALSGGNTLIIIAYKEINTVAAEPKPSKQFVEKLHLTHAVDPYSVKASIDKDSNLKIKAPFISSEPVCTCS